MRYGIVINLDYESHPYEMVMNLFRQIRAGMLASGFRQDGRMFTTVLPPRQACDLARRIIDDLDGNRPPGTEPIHRYIKEFFGVELTGATNLMLPSTDEISVVDLDEVEVIDLSSPIAN